MAIPILHLWEEYFTSNPNEGLGSSYERVVLNQKLFEFVERYHVKTVLEAPSFGFTGISGINSLFLARQGCQVTLLDHDRKRLEYIQQVWQQLEQPVRLEYVPDYDSLPFADKSFDMSWNFSALWYVRDLEKFLAEFVRLTRKIIILCVPNRSGLGYLSQKFLGKDDLAKYLNEKNIIPRNFIPILQSLGWQLTEHNYIDCPPWPDIGMHKEKFLSRVGLGWLLHKNSQPKEPITILDYYSGTKPDFQERMMRYYWFEKYAPTMIKFFWAHHKYYLFTPQTETEK